jgi:hypothetical protein
MTSPTKRSATNGFQQTVAGPVANRGVVVSLRKIHEARKGVVMPCLETLFQLGIRRPVPVVVYTGTKPFPRLNQSDFESCVGQRIRSDAASRTTPYDTDVEDLLGHCFSPEQPDSFI